MNNLESQLSQLRLHGMTRCWKALIETRRHNELSLSEGLELLVQGEAEERENRRYIRLQNNAKFRYKASVEELHIDPTRGVDKQLLTELVSGEYLSKGQSVLITGATGCGKSFMASALGNHACTQGYKVAYYNLQKLLIRTKMARLDGTIFKFLEKLERTDLLILDDFGLTHLEQQQGLDLMEIIEDRHSRRSTIISSQLPVASWYEVFGEETIADAILDRLIHTSFRIELKGESLRNKL